ncbi:ATP-binding protein [Fredinandcohnia sp. 179-A 10B2 NHS]|uniref:ATP-binding protein n=1 Tax=Fredinandcohnia sp. 179-A 10B2 NHS TaxID=3235176 RepID=UPI0039A1DA6A
MKIKSLATKDIYIYILLVILPTLLSTIGFIRIHNEYTQRAHAEEISDIVTFHKNYLDSFMGETIASAETLSLVLQSKNHEDEIKSLLTTIQGKDKRYSGLHLANLNGDILVTSLNLKNKVNVYEREYFQQVLQTKETRVSTAHTGGITGRYIVTIATPILNDSDLNGVLLVSIRLDYLENIIKVLTPDNLIRVSDSDNELLISTNNDFNDIEAPIIRSRLENVDWTIEGKAIIDTKDRRIFFINSGLFFILVLIFTHILFLLIKYMMLKRQARKERAENETQKLELVGTLAASTAHEIKNPLTGIKGLIQLLSERHKDPSDQFYFSVIQQEITRINDIVNEFLILGKPTADIVNSFDVTRVIKDLEPIIQSEANHYNVEFNVQLSNPVYITCVKDHIKQLVLNISKNAIESMENKGGSLRIVLSQDTTDCVIEFIDTGMGIPKRQLSKLFTPFYTNKETGTGLGLVICKRIVDMYNGSIAIDSKEGQGTIVQVKFPKSNTED